MMSITWRDNKRASLHSDEAMVGYILVATKGKIQVRESHFVYEIDNTVTTKVTVATHSSYNSLAINDHS